MRRTLLDRKLFERGTAFLCLSCWCWFFFCSRFLLYVLLFLPFLSLCQVLDPKIIKKTTTATSTRMKRKKGKKIYFLHPPLPPDNPPPPSVGKKVTNVWLFYLRVWWFRNLNTCIPVWQRRKTEISVSNTSLTLQGQLWKEHLSQVKDGINNYQRTFDFLLPYFPHHLKLFLLHLSRLKEQQKNRVF